MAAKKKPDLAFLAQILKETGVKEEVNEEEIAEGAELAKRQRGWIQRRNDQRAFNERGLIYAVHNPHSMTARICTNCGNTYYTSFCRDAICSDICRDEAFFKHYGVWPGTLMDPKKAAEFQSDYERHACLDPEQSARVFQLALTIIRDEMQVTGEYLGDTTLASELTPLLDRVSAQRAAFEEARTKTDTPQPEPQSEDDEAEETSEEETLEVPSFDLHFDELTFDLQL